MNPAPVIQWAVTGLCNYRCRHCFVGDTADQLTFSDLEILCRRMEEACVREVILTGGEPLLRNDLPELLRLLAECGIRVISISTNGSLLTERTLREIRESGHQPEITVSYDGDAGQHDWLRNVSGAEEAVFRALDLCREAGFTTGALMTLHRRNIGQLRSGLGKLADHGCSTVKVKPLLPLGRAAGTDTEVQCAGFPEIYDAFLDAITGYYAGEYPLRLRLGGFFAAVPGRKGWNAPMAQLSGKENGEERLLCGHAAVFPFLTADGRLLPCAGLASFERYTDAAPSLLEMSLEDGMRTPFFLQFANYTAGDQRERNSECAACPSAEECGGGCRMNALAFGKGFSGCDGSCCEYFREGWRNRIPDAIRRGLLEKMLNTGV